MVESIADRLKIGYVAETTFGEVPSGPPTLQLIRITDESLHQEASTESSAELRSDRQVADVIRTAISTSGDLNFELTYGSFDDFMEAVLQDDGGWSSTVTDVASDTSIAADGTGNQYTGADGEFANYTAGEWVEVRGFSNAENNGYAKITAINSSNPGTADNDEMVVEGLSLTTEGAGPSVTITQLASIVNGTTEKSFYIEKEFTDLTNEFAAYTGQVIDQMSLDTTAESKITGTVSLVGKKEESKTATQGDGSPTAVNSNSIFNASGDVDGVIEGGSSQGRVTAAQIQIGNNSRLRRVLGDDSPVSVGSGKFEVTGTLNVFFQSATLMNKFLNFTTSSLSIILEDVDGNAYIFDLPSVKYTSGQRVAGGESSDIMAELNFSAFLDATDGYTLKIARAAA